MTRSHQSEYAHGAGRRGLEGAASGNTALAKKERRHCPIWLTNIENGRRGEKKKNQRGEIKCGGAEGTGDYLTSAFLNLAPVSGGMLSSALSCLQWWHELIGGEIENHF